jgi:Na+-transporting methylmalonyl-CoA/oxaloacetate decarboxylase gamma subunit
MTTLLVVLLLLLIAAFMMMGAVVAAAASQAVEATNDLDEVSELSRMQFIRMAMK